jgi:hypothetical protein
MNEDGEYDMLDAELLSELSALEEKNYGSS